MALGVRSVGTASTPGTTSPHSVPTPEGGVPVSGDLLVAVLEYGTGAGTNHVTATGWTELAWKSTTAATGRTDLAVMGRISDGGEGATVAFTIAGTVNHVSGRMVAIQDHGLAVIGDVVAGTITGSDVGDVSPQTITVPGITVTPGSLVLIIAGDGEDADSTATFSDWTNANLSSITEQMDNLTTTGNGGGYGMATGVCAGTTTGDSTYVQAIFYAFNTVHLGVKPAAGSVPLGDNPLIGFLSRGAS